MSKLISITRTRPRIWATRTTSLPSARAPTSLPIQACRRYAQVRQTTPVGARDRSAIGVFTPAAAALFVATGVGLFYYFQYEKRKLQEKKEKELESRSVGRPHVGGPFTLTTHDGKPFSDQDLLGKWNFVYFGFTNCPDICPAELDKVGVFLKSLESEYGQIFQPVFISVDPARDSFAQMEKYLADFHPRFVGLAGDYSSIKSACKAYRVYFSTPPNADPKGDYLVDHSIYIYFMDPNGNFVEAFGQNSTPQDIIERVKKEMGEWEKETGRRV
ncbi:SCO1/SenC-domain-containing protein [Boletus reticuloceps]|uniref:SCO1/SenC-domain-containing protein n=1 Tax=Boletus reticuloceps TaxID=495285 RepID=A0A8I2YMR9_9AGAM|nr:SCO1/SenC-domain-containing protein [Boletus reticuloceps]